MDAASTTVPPPADDRLQEFLQAWDERVAPIAKARAEAWWGLATTGDSAAAEAARVAADAWTEAHRDIAASRRVQDARASGGVTDPVVRRHLEVVWLNFEQQRGDVDLQHRIHAIEAELQRTYAVHRGKIDGKPVDDARIAEILGSSTDTSLRRQAWLAAHSIGASVAPKVLELVRLRNELARSLGDPDYFTRALRLQEIDGQRLESLLTQLDEATATPFRTRKNVLDGEISRRLSVSVEELRPWHYADPFFQRPPTTGGVDLDLYYQGVDLPEVATRFFDGLGMNVRGVLAASDLYPRADKNQHAFCTHIDRRGDVRTLCNLVPSHRWMSTLLHELGHAVYDRYHDPALPWSLSRPAHALTTEAIAMMMGRVAAEPEFLTELLDQPLFQIQPLNRELRRQQAFSMLVFVRWALVMVRFERALYANPDDPELAERWWNLREQNQRLTCTERPEGGWAAKLHLALAPVYYPNYVLGEVLASQLRARLTTLSGRSALVDNSWAGEYLIAEVFRLANTMRWDHLVQHATGAPLGPADFLREFVTTER